MQLGTTYRTWAGSKATSSASFALKDVENTAMLNYTGDLHWGRKVVVKDVRHVWLTATHPINITGYKTTTSGTTQLFKSEGLMLLTTAFDESGITLEIEYPEPLASNPVESTTIQLQAWANSLNTNDE